MAMMAIAAKSTISIGRQSSISNGHLSFVRQQSSISNGHLFRENLRFSPTIAAPKLQLSRKRLRTSCSLMSNLAPHYVKVSSVIKEQACVGFMFAIAFLVVKEAAVITYRMLKKLLFPPPPPKPKPKPFEVAFAILKSILFPPPPPPPKLSAMEKLYLLIRKLILTLFPAPPPPPPPLPLVLTILIGHALKDIYDGVLKEQLLKLIKITEGFLMFQVEKFLPTIAQRMQKIDIKPSFVVFILAVFLWWAFYRLNKYV